MSAIPILRLGAVKNVERFKDHMRALGLNIPCDHEVLAGPECLLCNCRYIVAGSNSTTVLRCSRWKAGMRVGREPERAYVRRDGRDLEAAARV